MKWLGKPSSFQLFTNPSAINWFIFGQGIVIDYFITSGPGLGVWYLSKSAGSVGKHQNIYTVYISYEQRLLKTQKVPQSNVRACSMTKCGEENNYMEA